MSADHVESENVTAPAGRHAAVRAAGKRAVQPGRTRQTPGPRPQSARPRSDAGNVACLTSPLAAELLASSARAMWNAASGSWSAA